MLSNNDILKKIRIALALRDEDVLHILSLTGFKMTKGALNDFTPLLVFLQQRRCMVL